MAQRKRKRRSAPLTAEAPVAPSACGRQPRFRRTRFVAPQGAPPEAPAAQPACGRCPIGRFTSHGTLRHSQLHMVGFFARLISIEVPPSGLAPCLLSGKVLSVKLCCWPPVYNNNGSRLILPHNLLKNRALAWDFLAFYHRIAAPA